MLARVSNKPLGKKRSTEMENVLTFNWLVEKLGITKI